VVDGEDVDAVADAIIGLLRDPDRAAMMGAAGRAWVERDWTWAATAASLAEMLG
jgi:phosphatidylinositol alpha-1,6-mannosyltransferase